VRNLKIVLSVLFILAVAWWVAKNWTQSHKPVSEYETVQVAKPRPAPAVKTALSQEKPQVFPDYRMAVILDDWGTNYGLLKQAVELHRPITLSILPHLKYSRQIAEEAHKSGLGVMLHMPMEPKKAREKMEPQTILTTTPDAEVIRFLDEAVADIPYTEGVNNHTGSKATGDRRIMRLVLRRLKSINLFFVDSVVTPESVGPEIAEESGIAFAKRNVFIDNEPAKDAIKKEIQRAKDIALKKGQVVVIGHDRKVTLAALKEEIPEIEKAGVRLVLVRELVKKVIS